MSNTSIKLKKSSVVGKVPTTSDIDYGELAINYADGKIYYKNSANEIKAFLDSAGVATLIASGGSGVIDADTLDGQDGTFYLDYNNFTNTPYIPTLGNDYVDSAQVSTIISSTVNSSFINALTIDADTLGGQSGSYYLNYNNFTNTPNVLDSADIISVITTSGFTKYDSADAAGQISTALVGYATETYVNNAVDALPDSAQVSGIIVADVTKTFIDNLNVDADTLDNQDGTYYLNYNNFTNTPTIPALGIDFVDSAEARKLISVTDAGGDGSLTYSNATGVFTYTGPSAAEVRAHFSGGTGITITNGTIATNDSQIVHDNLSGFVANEHINHSSVTLTAGNGLTGGGDITASRTFSVGAGTGVTVNADNVAIGQDVATTANVTFNSVTTTDGLIVGGNLQVNGTTTTVNTQNLSIADNMFYLNQLESDNSPIVSVDVGWAANVNDDGTYQHVGIFRDATDNTFKVFEGYLPEPDAALEINTGDASFSLAPFAARTLSGKYLGADSDIDARLSGGTGITYTSGVIATNDSQIIHDNLSGFVANEHVNHSAVSITAGAGLTGGGDITTSRTLNIGQGTGITVGADAISTNDSQIVHDNLSGFVANEHIDHTTVSITAGSGLTGGGTIAATRTINVGAGSYIIVNADDVAVDATSANTASKVVARDASGNFSAGTITASLTGNATSADSADNATFANNAARWTTARTITLGGDLTGNVSLDGSANVTLTATIAANSVALGTDTTGNYVAAGATSGNGISGSVSSEGGTFTVTSNATNTNTGSTIVFRDASGNFSAGTITAALSGNASTATALQTARTIGGVSFDGTANINLPGVNTTGNQNTTGSAATLTTTRTLWGQNFNGSANVTGALSSVTTVSMSGQLTSTVATGTAPFVVASTTAVSNLNADLLDGQHGSYYQPASTAVTTTTITNYTLNPRFATTIGFGNDTEVLKFNDTTNETRSGYWTSKDGFYVQGDGNSVDAVVLKTGNLELSQNGYVTGTFGVGGKINIGTTASIEETSTTLSTVTQTVIGQWSTTTYSGGKYLIQATRSGERHITEILITHNGTTAVATEYGSIWTSTALATYDVDISGGNFRILARGTSSTSTVYEILEIHVI